MAYTTIDDPSLYHQTLLYTGNGSGSRALTNTGNSDLQPDWLWIKNRSNAVDHGIWDSSRGAGKRLTISTGAEEDQTNVASFNSDGFTVNTGDIVNTNSHTYVAWQWKANGGTTTSFTESGGNPGGDRQVNTTAGFSIIDYVGTGSAGTIAHGLGATPEWIVFKDRSGDGDNWFVYHQGTGNGGGVRFDTNAATGSDSNRFNNTSPNSTNFTVGASGGVNDDGKATIAYCFTPIKGYSKFGTYRGNGNANGNFVFTGFKPAFLITKKYSASDHWKVYDTQRDQANDGSLTGLKVNANDNESDSGTRAIDLLSNGFKLRETDGDTNGVNQDYIFIAFAEHPFVSSKGVPVTAR